MLAVTQGHLEIITYLIENKTNPFTNINAKNHVNQITFY